MNIPEEYIDSINLGRGYKLIRYDNSIVVMKGNLFVIDDKGKVSSQNYIKYNSFDEAFQFVKKIFSYFDADLSNEDIIAWRDYMMGEDENDNEEYRNFAAALLEKDYTKAFKLLNKMDTYLQDGVSERIFYEIEKNLFK